MTVFPDTEGALRNWLRAHPTISPLVGNKVFFGVPNDTKLPSPMILIARLGGLPDVSVPNDQARIEFQVWADTKHAATQVELLLTAALFDIESESLDGDTFCYGTTIASRIWLPDPGSGTPRYLVEAVVTARAGSLQP